MMPKTRFIALITNIITLAVTAVSVAQTATPAIDGNLAVLGDGVLTPVSSMASFSDASAVFTPRAGTSYYGITYGVNANTNISESLSRISSGNQDLWRRTGAPGHFTDFAVTPAGVFKTQLTDPDHQLLFRYDPGEPEIIAGMAPGESRQFSYVVTAVSDSNSSRIEAHGQMTVDFTYMGQYQLTTPAGPIVAHGFSKVLTGKIGPTINNTTLYVFYAEGIGEVARIDHTDIHALLLYNRDTRNAYLLQKLPEFVKP